LTQGIVPGVGGVLVFVPQIAILFFFIGVLEETGYMTRVVFIMDRLVRPFGLNGRSVVPLVSSAACAIPAILSTRVIGNPKERLITILVSPLISCSARIPVFVLLIYLVIPNTYVYGFIGVQGMVLFALYALGVIGALLVAMVMNKFIRSTEKSFLLLEMPEYRWPRWKNILLHLKEKVQAFVFDAGKIILAISIVLWALPSRR
jgi:ferrous iron transport protein B